MIEVVTRRIVIVLVAAAICISWGPVGAQVLPEGLKIEKVLDSTAELGDLAISPTNEIWLLERLTGTIRVYVHGTEAATLVVSVSTLREQGLLDVAFAPDYATSGTAFISYVDLNDDLRVDAVQRTLTGLTLGSQILNAGTTPQGRQPGGGLAVGPDGKLYLAVGDLGTSSNGQNDAVFAGKVLRANLDGSVPSDNPSGTLIWAKGFRDGKDLAINPNTARTNGTLYLADVGNATQVFDEINAVAQGGNYGWSAADGPDPSYDDPLVWGTELVPEALEVLGASSMGMEGSLVYACVEENRVRQSFLTGSEMDQLDVEVTFYNPDGDPDGVPDTTCPTALNALAQAGDGWLYAATSGTNPGIWRVWRDLPGAREVSAPGSPFPLTVDKNGANLTLGWENLGTVDVGLPARNGGQHVQTYRVWEGDLPISGAIAPTAIADTDGVADGPARLTWDVAPGTGNHYYLVTAQAENREGTFGAGRPDGEDYCDLRGWGTDVGDCADVWRNPVNGTELRLKDVNPQSPTYNQLVGLGDFRGKVVRMDISADDCFWCNAQTGAVNTTKTRFAARDFASVTIFTESFVGPCTPYATEAACAAAAAGWVARNGGDHPILCDTDHDGNNFGDVSEQYWEQAACGGTPQNFYIDQAMVLYDFVCGGETSALSIQSNIQDEVNPEFCE